VTYHEDYQEFCQQNLFWLEDYALFQCLKSSFQGKPWNQWPSEIKNRHQGTIQKLKKEVDTENGAGKDITIPLFNQWNRLKNYCRKKRLK